MTESGAISLGIVDSVSALVPEAEANEDIEKQTMGLQARLMSKECRKLTPITAKTNTTVIFLNQIREKIGVMYGN
jgi:recombination protein RecA